MMTDTPERVEIGDDPATVTRRPKPRLASPLDEDVDRATLQRLLDELEFDEFDDSGRRTGRKVKQHWDVDAYIELVTDPTQWTQMELAEALNASRPTISVYRMRGTKEGASGPVGLPKPQGKLGQTPWWYKGTLCRWAIWRGWMFPDGRPAKPKGRDRTNINKKPRGGTAAAGTTKTAPQPRHAA